MSSVNASFPHQHLLGIEDLKEAEIMPPEQFAVWSASAIEYVVLENAGLVHQEAMDELDARCPGAVQLQASWGGGMLVRLDWDDACRDVVVPEAVPGT